MSSMLKRMMKVSEQPVLSEPVFDEGLAIFLNFPGPAKKPTRKNKEGGGGVHVYSGNQQWTKMGVKDGVPTPVTMTGPVWSMYLNDAFLFPNTEEGEGLACEVIESIIKMEGCFIKHVKKVPVSKWHSTLNFLRNLVRKGMGGTR